MYLGATTTRLTFFQGLKKRQRKLGLTKSKPKATKTRKEQQQQHTNLLPTIGKLLVHAPEARRNTLVVHALCGNNNTPTSHCGYPQYRAPSLAIPVSAKKTAVLTKGYVEPGAFQAAKYRSNRISPYLAFY